MESGILLLTLQGVCDPHFCSESATAVIHLLISKDWSSLPTALVQVIQQISGMRDIYLQSKGNIESRRVHQTHLESDSGSEVPKSIALVTSAVVDNFFDTILSHFEKAGHQILELLLLCNDNSDRGTKL